MDLPEYFEAKTDAWVFGNKKGYLAIVESLRGASLSGGSVHLKPLFESSASMLGVVLAPQRKVKARKLKFWERFVVFEGKPRMELVIFGSVAGYRYLAERIEDFAASCKAGVEDHLHFDDWGDPIVCRRSIALCFRGPLRKLSRDHLGDYESLVFRDPFAGLPQELSYRFNELAAYEEIKPDSSHTFELL